VRPFSGMQWSKLWGVASLLAVIAWFHNTLKVFCQPMPLNKTSSGVLIHLVIPKWPSCSNVSTDCLPAGVLSHYCLAECIHFVHSVHFYEGSKEQIHHHPFSTKFLTHDKVCCWSVHFLMWFAAVGKYSKSRIVSPGNWL